MIRKYSVLLSALMAMLLLYISASMYPGGSRFDRNSKGFDWTKNFVSNLFDAKAINGADHPGRLWADLGMVFLSLTFGLFFVHFSKKIPSRSAANVVKFLGGGSTLFTFLIVTPLHDLMISVASTLFLVSLFYITVYILKSRLFWFKVFCITCLLIHYYSLYLYGSGNWNNLPVMQKVTFFSSILLVIGLEYFTSREDFANIGVVKSKE
jgi:hypothetical protein